MNSFSSSPSSPTSSTSHNNIIKFTLAFLISYLSNLKRLALTPSHPTSQVPGCWHYLFFLTPKSGICLLCDLGDKEADFSVSSRQYWGLGLLEGLTRGHKWRLRARHNCGQCQVPAVSANFSLFQPTTLTLCLKHTHLCLSWVFSS